MDKNKRNIIIAVVLLVVLLVAPFWPNIQRAVHGEDAATGASPETVTCQVEVAGEGTGVKTVTLSYGATALEALQTLGPDLVEADGDTVIAIGGRAGEWVCTLGGTVIPVTQEVQEGDNFLWQTKQ